MHSLSKASFYEVIHEMHAFNATYIITCEILEVQHNQHTMVYRDNNL